MIDYSKDYHTFKPSLYRESPNLDTLMESILSTVDIQQQDLLWVAYNILNVDLAEKSHLDFIGNIVGQPRKLIDFNNESFFGFDNSYKSETFGSKIDESIGGFWNSRSYFNSATARVLNDEEYRRLIKARVIYNSSNCVANELLEVINLITDSQDNVVQILKHGYIQVKTYDTSGLLSYFIDRVDNKDNILPIAAGVRVILEGLFESPLAIVILTNLLEKLVNEDLPE